MSAARTVVPSIHADHFHCGTCNASFTSVEERNAHYKTEWHRYNLKRKAANLASVTSVEFEYRQQGEWHACPRLCLTWRTSAAEKAQEKGRSRGHVKRGKNDGKKEGDDDVTSSSKSSAEPKKVSIYL